MPILIVCITALLLALSAPVRVSVRRMPHTMFFVRWLFFSMTFAPHGHTDQKKQLRTRRRRHARRPIIPITAYLPALRYVLSHSVVTVDRLHLPRELLTSSTVLGLFLWGAGTALAAVDTASERLLTVPATLSEQARARGGITLTFAPLSALVGAGLFLYMYIKRKSTSWRKQA